MNCTLIGKTPGTVIFMDRSGSKWFSKPNISQFWCNLGRQKWLTFGDFFQFFFSKIQTHADMFFSIMVLGRHFGMY